MPALARSRADAVGLSREARALRAANARGTLKKGIGFAAFMHGAGFTGSGEDHLASVVAVEATPDGPVRVLSASTEIGQGTNTIFSQIAADALGIDGADVDVVQPDTSVVPNSGPTVASRTCMVVGKLVETAALELRACSTRPPAGDYAPRSSRRVPRYVAAVRAAARLGPVPAPARRAVGRRAVRGRRVRHVRLGGVRRGGDASTRRRARCGSTTSSPCRRSAR